MIGATGAVGVVDLVGAVVAVGGVVGAAVVDIPNFLVGVGIFGVLGVCAPFGATFTALMLLFWVVFPVCVVDFGMLYCTVWAGPSDVVAVLFDGRGWSNLLTLSWTVWLEWVHSAA